MTADADVEAVAHAVCMQLGDGDCEKCSLSWKGPLGGVRGCIYDATKIARAAIAADPGRKRMEEALTPSADTKAAYIDEFSHNVRCISDEGEEQMFTATVPWTTIKEIMAAIRARAALDEDGTREG